MMFKLLTISSTTPHRQEADKLNIMLEAAESKLQSNLLSRHSDVKSVAKFSRIEERQQYSKMLASQRSALHIEEKVLLDNQREAKNEKQKLLRKKNACMLERVRGQADLH